jgi:catechol 2,3-dioxygenase-like lactoylglutathione lyase family enzyme
MINIQSVFSGFSVKNLDEAKQFYNDVLGIKTEDEIGGTRLIIPGGAQVWMYSKEDHQPATYTTLNLVVDDIKKAHSELIAAGVQFEHYPNSPQDENGIMWGKEKNMGPNIAWFKDPAGNILSILEI